MREKTKAGIQPDHRSIHTIAVYLGGGGDSVFLPHGAADAQLETGSVRS